MYRIINLFFLLTGIIAITNGQTISLGGNDWKIRDIPNDTTRIFCSDWIAATVPGNIQADLEKALILKPLWYGAGDNRLYDVAKNKWCYRKDFMVPKEFSGKRLRLAFDGVDYSCEVWLNGKMLGSNKNMFRQFKFEVSNALKIGESNRLEVYIESIPPELSAYIDNSDGKENGTGTPWYYFNGLEKTIETLRDLKSPTNFGWDWGVNVWTLGIWKDVRVEATNMAAIEHVKIETPLSDQYRKAKVQVKIKVNSLAAISGTLKMDISGHGIKRTFEKPFSISGGSHLVDADIELDNPALWWPNGHGEANLYQLKVTFQSRSGKVFDSYSSRFGIREVRWEHTTGAPADFPEKYMPVVNGRKIRMIGSNMIPADLLFAKIPERAPHLLNQAKASGFNTLRMWGGGVIYTPDIYDLADELGLMLVVEVPLANMDPVANQELLNNLDATLRNIIHQVWNHPSIIEYTGGNEMRWGDFTNKDFTVLNHIRKIFTEEDPGRIFRDTDPVEGGSHGPWYFPVDTKNTTDPLRVYTVWNKTMPFVTDELKTAVNKPDKRMRYGEFGYQTPGHLEVWHRYIPLSAQWPIDKENPIIIRKNITNAVFSTDAWLGKPVIDYLFGDSPDLEFLLKAGQYIGAEGLRYAVDAILRRGAAVGGMMTWDFNEPWTNGAGNYQIDYEGRPLMNNTFMRQSVSPLALSLKHTSSLYNLEEGINTTLYLTSDMDQTEKDLIWSWKARDRRGTVISKEEGRMTVNPLEVKKLTDITVQLPDSICFGPVVLELKLSDISGKTLTERIHIFGLSGVRSSLRGLLDLNILDQDDDKKMLGELFKQIRKEPVGTKRQPEIFRPVKQTTLEVTSYVQRVENQMEVLEIELTNTGKMTALFCEPKPIVNYRTDLIWDNLYISIPPGETRTISVRAPLRAKDGLTLSQTGWQIESWNSAPVRIGFSPDMLLTVGRKDQMCREFAGYPGLAPAIKDSTIRLSGRQPDPARIPYLLDHSKTVELVFEGNAKSSATGAVLHLNFSDQSLTGAIVNVNLNGVSVDKALPEGYGFQKTDPAQLARARTAEVKFPKGTIKPGNNLLKIQVLGGGWLTWDSLNLLQNEL